MSSDAATLDLTDFDAMGIAADIIVAVRAHALQHEVSTTAEVSAPQGWHRVVVNCSPTGNVNLRVRFVDLTTSRANNVTKALVARDWLIDEDCDGASTRFLPGAEAASIAFEVLAVLSLAGAPGDRRTVTAIDSAGAQIALGPTN